MKFLFIDTYYSSFLNRFRNVNSDLINFSYNRQKEKLLSFCFGTSDFYSYNLKLLGHKADDIIANEEILQRQWGKENRLMISETNLLSKIQLTPFFHRFFGRPKWLQEVVLAQIEESNPDVLYLQDLSILNPDTLKKAKRYCKLLVGQIACPLPSEKQIKCFDLILTSFPHYVQYFRKLGIKSEYFKLAFEPRVLKKIGNSKKIYDVSFIGSFSYHHRGGTKLLEKVVRETPVNIWGQGLNIFSSFSPLYKNYHGQVWGLDMYRILAQSKIVINRHISVARNYANNMRLYEATGMGAMLITDEKENLNNLFEVGKEIIMYKNSTDLIQKIKYFLTHEKERLKIAKAGQKRTLGGHTYKKRMKELISNIKKYL